MNGSEEIREEIKLILNHLKIYTEELLGNIKRLEKILEEEE
jgi:hypothetical protein